MNVKFKHREKIHAIKYKPPSCFFGNLWCGLDFNVTWGSSFVDGDITCKNCIQAKRAHGEEKP